RGGRSGDSRSRPGAVDVSCGWIRLDLDRHSEVDPPAGDIGDAADAANAACALLSDEAGGWRLRLVRVRLWQVAEHLVDAGEHIGVECDSGGFGIRSDLLGARGSDQRGGDIVVG